MDTHTESMSVGIQKWFSTVFSVIALKKCPSWKDMWSLWMRSCLTYSRAMILYLSISGCSSSTVFIAQALERG